MSTTTKEISLISIEMSGSNSEGSCFLAIFGVDVLVFSGCCGVPVILDLSAAKALSDLGLWFSKKIQVFLDLNSN